MMQQILIQDYVGGEGGIKQDLFLSLSNLSLAHTLTATCSHQDACIQVERPESQHQKIRTSECFDLTSSLGFPLTSNGKLAVRENCFLYSQTLRS